MPLVTTREGCLWDVPQEWIDRGSFQMPIRTLTTQGTATTYATFARQPDGQWVRTEEERGAIDHPDRYDDALNAPEFPGWEVVADPSKGTYGDIYVCIDPRLGRDYERFGPPNLPSDNPSRKVSPMFGNPKPSAGFRIYRKKKILGPVRLLPSQSFSQPLPLP